MTDVSRIPVSLLTGFLGSGKTTLLNYLVQQPEMKDTLVIINEFGEVGLDHLLVTHTQESIVVEMSSGCLCCTIRGDLQKTLKDIHWRFAAGGKQRFNRVVIETTGLASPVPVLHTLMTDEFIAGHYRLDGVIVTVDAVNGMATLTNHEEAVQQAAVADRLLLTKTDLASAEQLQALQQRLGKLNPSAPQILSVQGKVNPDELLGAGLFRVEEKHSDVSKWLSAEAYDDHAHDHHDHHEHHHGHDHSHHHHDDVNRHDDHIRAFCMTFDEPISPEVFEEWLGMFMGFKGDNVLRIKGIINLAGQEEPVVVHGVQHVFHPPVTLLAWPDEDRRTRLVFITKDIEKDTIERSFTAFNAAWTLQLEQQQQQNPADPYAW